MRLAGRLLGFLVGVVPAGILLIWGLSYFRTVWAEFESTQTAFGMAVPAGKSQLYVVAQGIKLDIPRMTARVHSLKVYDASDRLIGRGEELEVSQPSSVLQRARARLVWMKVARDERGKMSFEQFMGQKGPEGPSLQLQIDHAALDYSDASGGHTPWNQLIRLRKVSMVTGGGKQSGTAEFTMPNLLEGTVTFHNSDPDGYQVSGNVRGELARVLNRLSRTKEGLGISELTRLHLASGSLAGPFEVFGNTKGEVHFVSNAAIELKGIEFDNYNFDSVKLHGTITERSFQGEGFGTGPGLQAQLNGYMLFGAAPSFVGRLDGRVASLASLPQPLQKLVPREVSFGGGAFSGWIDMKDGVAKGSGNVAFERFGFQDEQLQAVRGNLVLSGNDVGFGLNQAFWRGSPVSGKVVALGNRLGGDIRSGTVNIATLARAYKVEGVGGTATLHAVLAGSPQKPLIAWTADGRAWSSASGSRLDLGTFTSQGLADSRQVTVRRVHFEGDNGTGVATGKILLDSGKYAFDVRGRGIPLSVFTKEATGQATFALNLVGKGAEYDAKGILEVFNASAADGVQLSYGLANISGTPGELKAKDVVAYDDKGAKLTGWLGVRPKDRQIYGQLAADGISLGDYSDGQLLGTGRFRQGIISGTLDKPIFLADVEAESLVAGNVRLNRVRGDLEFNGQTVDVKSLVATTDQGEISGSAHALLSDKSGNFAMKLKDLGISSILGGISSTASIDGAFEDGELSGTFGDGKILDLTGFVQVHNFAINDSLVGSGRIDVAKKDGQWSADGAIGYDKKYVEVAVNAYKEESGEIDAQVTMGDIGLDQVYSALKRYTLPDGDRQAQVQLSDELATLFPLLRGGLSADAHVTGTIDEPQVDMKVLKIEDAFVGDSILSQAQPPIMASLDANGSYSKKGLSLHGGLRNLNPAWFALVSPNLAGMNGALNLDSFDVTGPLDDPSGTVSLSYTDSQPVSENARQKGLSMVALANLDAGKVHVDGNYAYEGFTGELAADFGLKDWQIPDDSLISAEVALGRLQANTPAEQGRPLSELTELFPILDAGRSSGILTAKLSVRGTPKDLNITGHGSLVPETEGGSVTLAAKNDPNVFENVDLQVNADRNGLTVNGGAHSHEGGNVTLNSLAYMISDLDAALKDGWSSLSKEKVGGSIGLEALRLKYNDKQAGPMAATLDGNLLFSRVLEAPHISGTINVSKAQLAVPTIPESTGGEFNSPVNPTFDVSVNSTSPVLFSAGAGKFSLNALSKITGSLESPVADALMIVERGTIQLPNSRISIDQGGTISISYRADQTRADLDMTGHTQLTSVGPNGLPNRYDINLVITGNLLADNGLRLQATSDPPDMSESQILAMLGQRQLLEGISLGADPAKQLQAALMQVALPYLAGNITDKLATGLGIDFLALDYNPFDEFSVNAGAKVGRYFTLSGRRQLSTPKPGQKPKFDIRLSYRPPFGGKVLRRISFSIGFDQDRPIKLGVEYGIRF